MSNPLQPDRGPVRFRRRTAEGWNETNPLLRRGEPGYETDTGMVKIGDGITHWVDLEYVGDALTSALADRISILEEAGDGGGVQKAEVKLTQEEILQLSVVPKILIPATQTNPGYAEVNSVPVVISAYFAMKLGATAYGNFNPSARNPLYLCYGSDFSMGIAYAVDQKPAYATGVSTPKEADMRTVMGLTSKRTTGRFHDSTRPERPSMKDNALGLIITRDVGPTGPLTGGSTSDWLKVTVWYEVVDLT